jgi:hypothetical protein
MRKEKSESSFCFEIFHATAYINGNKDFFFADLANGGNCQNLLSGHNQNFWGVPGGDSLFRRCFGARMGAAVTKPSRSAWQSEQAENEWICHWN